MSPKWSINFRFSDSLYACLISAIRAMCPAHLLLLDLIAPVIFGETTREASRCFIYILVLFFVFI
jgi:hypothetical protein